MPRAKTILQSDFPYHIAARSINRDWFNIPMDDVWQIMSEQLFFIHHAFGVQIHCFVLMNNHFHLIISTPGSNIDKAMEWFMRETSKSLTFSGNRINQSYGGRYFRSVLSRHNYFLHAYKYVYANPLRAGICKNAEGYRYSTLGGLLGLRPIPFPLEEDATLFSDVEGTLNWVNTPASFENWEVVRKGLRRGRFSLTRDLKKPHALENDML